MPAESVFTPMPDAAIRLQGIGKSYVRFARPVDRLKALMFRSGSFGEPFWALKNVTLNIPHGKTVGIVGRNGSGKSTLLQIIAGTLTPTEGRVQVQGRISALLELGSGFNPEFTGKENAIFQGQISGLSRAEIERKMPDVERFADVGAFINEPLKAYSSGMGLRLAFAVAISVEPDVLIVDEALAVGDEAFQRKCFARIRQLQEGGATVLFVSHSGSAIVELCDRAILMDGGELLGEGSPKDVVTAYHKLLFAAPDQVEALREQVKRDGFQSSSNGAELNKTDAAPKPDQTAADAYDPNMLPQSTVTYPSRGAVIERPRFLDDAGRLVNILTPRQWYVYCYTARFSEAAFRVRFGMLIKNITGVEIAGALSHPFHSPLDYIPAGRVAEVRFRFQCLLPAGAYFANAGISAMVESTETYLHRMVDAAMFRVQVRKDNCATGLADLLISPGFSLTAAGADAPPFTAQGQAADVQMKALAEH